MISSRRSTATERNTRIRRVDPPPRRPVIEDWARRLAGRARNVTGTLVLVGGVDLLHFRLRVAQSHVRDDMAPSFWSHVGVLVEDRGQVRLREAALDPPGGFAGMPKSNGVAESPLARYQDPRRFPNVAVLRLPVDPRQVPGAIERVRGERGMLDLAALILSWLGFAWGAGGQAANPLLGGSGVPSAAFAEAVFGALGVELTPGLSTRSSCPEAIWQAALWWHPYYARRLETDTGKLRVDASRMPAGYYWVGQPAAALTAE